MILVICPYIYQHMKIVIASSDPYFVNPFYMSVYFSISPQHIISPKMITQLISDITDSTENNSADNFCICFEMNGSLDKTIHTYCHLQ